MNTDREKFFATLSTFHPEFIQYTRLGFRCLEGVMAHPLRPKQGWTPEEALWDLTQKSKGTTRYHLATQLYEFLDMYSYLDTERT